MAMIESALDEAEQFGQDSVESAGEKCEIKIWHKRHRRDGKLEVVPGARLEDTHTDGAGDLRYALVATKAFDDKGVLENSLLQVNSPLLLKVFRELVGSYPTVPSDFETPVEMERPFQMLFHYWDELDQRRQNTDDDSERMHLNLLFNFMKVELGSDKLQCDNMFRKKSITWTRLWTVYRPGDLLYTIEEGHPWLLRCQKTAYEETVREGKFLEVHCTYTDYDGKDIGEARHVIKVYQKRSFAAENPAVITDLPVYPLAFLQVQDGLKERLSKRGLRFLNLKGICVQRYDGVAKHLKSPPSIYYHPDMGDFEGVWMPFTETGRVVIDRKTFQEENHIERVTIRSQELLGSNEMNVNDPMLCPPAAYGFSLARKEWCRFYVDQIRDPQWKEDPLDSLVLDKNQKQLLAALTASHIFPGDARDQPAQKGKGLVVLLHGSPGSGKTLTAESAAEMTKKALLSATMGELNQENSAWWFERELKRLLQYATTWEAVVLLDEADVFLETRQEGVGSVTERNALVAVFLKYLEYFSGILFLTSNRVSVFDEAMKSRIHLALEYSPPSINMRRILWIKCLESIHKADLDLDIQSATNNFVKDNMNGREITNAVNTARTLARHNKEKLQVQHIDTVLQVRRDFDASLARLKKLRNAEEQHNGLQGLVRRNSLLDYIHETDDES